MKTLCAVVLAVGTMLVPTASLAGWGAIACDVRGSGACSTSYGWGSLGAAQAYAMRLCSNRGYRCRVARWEHNMCTYGPYGSWACN